MRLLIVEDEPLVADAIATSLRSHAYAVDVARDGIEAGEQMSVNSYDAVLLDWNIPSPNDLSLLKSWREAGNVTPVLMLSGRSRLSERITALDCGADDYLTKPYELDELLARLRSIIRRGPRPLHLLLSFGGLELDRAAHVARLWGRPLALNPKEFALLEYFLSHRDRVIPRTELIEHIWDNSFDSMSNVVEVTVYRLRRKIEGPSSPVIRTVRGVGYLLENASSPKHQPTAQR